MNNLIDEAIKKNNLKGIYFLYGDDFYEISKYIEKVKKSFLNLTLGVNFFVIDQDNLLELDSAINTTTFFGEEKLIYIKDAEFQFNIDLLKDISNEKLVIIISEKSIDKRLIGYKELSKISNCIEINKFKEKQAIEFAINTLKAYKIQVSKEVAKYLISIIGVDKDILINEFRKIVAYLDRGASLEIEHINDICSKTAETKMFFLIDYILEQKKEKALQLFEELLDSKTHPLAINIMLFRQFKNIYIILVSKLQGISREEIEKKIKVHPFVFAKLYKSIDKYSKQDLEKILEDFATYNHYCKIGKMDYIINLKQMILLI